MDVNVRLTHADNTLITHSTQSHSKLHRADYAKILKNKNDLTLPLEQALEMLEQLGQFELGRFLLSNKGLNGYWTSYIILQGLKKENLHPLEK